MFFHPSSAIEQSIENRKCHETSAATPKKGHGAHEAVTDFMSRNVNIKELLFFSNYKRNQAENCYSVMANNIGEYISIYNLYIQIYIHMYMSTCCRCCHTLIDIRTYVYMHMAVQKQKQKLSTKTNACVSRHLQRHRHRYSGRKKYFITTKTI